MNSPGRAPRPSPLTIRRAGRADLSAIDALEQVSFSIDRFSRAVLKRLLSTPTADCFIAEEGAAAAGYAIVLYRAGASIARLYSIAVDPSARGRGVAQDLVNAAILAAGARGARALRLEVRASNRSALSLYQRAGFTFLERRPGYYLDGEDALRLEKRLDPREAGGRSAQAP